MSYFDDASLVMIPSGYKDQKVYSVKPIDGSGDLTFTRSNDTATRVGPDGLIQKVRTNVLTYSNDTSNADWSRVGATSTSGQSGYDGSSDAWLFSATGGGSHYALQSKTDTGILTFSIYAKQGTSKGIRIAINGGGDHWANFNLDLGTQIGTAASVIDTEITSVGGGWYRISVTANKTTTFGWGVVYILDSSFATAFTAAGETIYIQDAQLESGDIATDYIATTSAAVSVGPVANLPRLDYLGSSCPRLLLEPQRTNLVQYSESFNTSSSWSLSRTSAFGSGSVANAVTSPDGYTNAEYIQQATGETDGGGCFQGISYTSGASYTLSVFAKQGENRYVRIGFGIGSGGAGIFCGFDLQDGIAGTPDTGVTAKIENYNNGWYRCSITATAQITGARNTFVYQSSNLNTFVTTPLQGIYVWGAQLEESYYETSYIPTLGAAVTRGADSASKTGIASLIGQSEGTIFVDFQLDQTPSDLNGRLLQLWATSDTTDSIIPLINQSNQLQVSTYSSSTGAAIIPASASTLLGLGQNKIAVAYTSTSVVVYRNGVLFASGNPTGFFPTSLTSLDLGGSSSSARNLGNPINQALLFKTRLSNADLAALTA